MPDLACRGVPYFLLGSTLFLAGEYPISCWGVPYFLLGSTLFLAGEYPTGTSVVFTSSAGVSYKTAGPFFLYLSGSTLPLACGLANCQSLFLLGSTLSGSRPVVHFASQAFWG
jgi:hypothetical protein